MSTDESVLEGVENEEVDEDESSFYDGCKESSEDVEGITGQVSSFTFTNINYPCFIFREGSEIPKYKLRIVANMVKSGNMQDKDTSLYFMQNGDLYKIGSLSGLQIMGFIDLIGIDNLIGYASKDEKLEGSSLYCLCTC